MAPSRTARTTLYVTVVVTAGGAALIASVYELYQRPIPHEWMLLAALTLLSFFFAIRVPGIPAKMSVSESFVFATVLLFGTAAATVTVALDALIMSGWRHRRDPLKLTFNATEPTLSIWIASQLFFLIVGVPLRIAPRDGTDLLLPVLLLSLTYFALNSTLTAIAIALESGTKVFSVLRGHLLWLALNYLGSASIAVLIVQNSTNVNITTISILLPLLIITYLTFKSSMGRIEDADQHLAQLNRLYMSTIETLAMAVDAKDQTTHGHIRRVQTHAVALAKTLGLDDRELIRAVEAAALLHDIGKLAVPEHVLNKPGKLTDLEFEQMKAHASLGADILSSAEFPYPVVPIVRHHHENWNGSGYPDGLSGTDIPIGARLLAVVDCFDAVTSDRPYRQRMTRSEAIEVLLKRRGTMYDPLIVDAFIGNLEQIAPADPTEREQGLEPIGYRYDRKSMAQLFFNQSMNIRMYEAQRRAVETVFAAAALHIACSIEKHLPESVFVLYRFDSHSNELIASDVTTAFKPMLAGLRIPHSRQLSGWVAANKQTVVNAEPQLDLAGLTGAESFTHALATPIVSGTVLFGVLAIYRRTDIFFTPQDTEFVESLGRSLGSQLATMLANSNDTLHELHIAPRPALRVVSQS